MNWKLITSVAIGVAATSCLEVRAQTQPYGTLPSPGTVYAGSTPNPDNNYLLQSETSEPFSLKRINILEMFSPNAALGITVAAILKIALKLLIFKLIVKMMAVICAMLYFPTFQSAMTTPTIKPTTMMPTTSMTTAESPSSQPGYYSYPLMQDSEESGYYNRMMKSITSEPVVCPDSDWSCRLDKSISKRYGMTKDYPKKGYTEKQYQKTRAQ